MTSRASSTDWNSLTENVNSDILGEAGALAALPNERGREGVSWAKTDAKYRSLTDWLFPEDFQLQILTAYDYLGQR